MKYVLISAVVLVVCALALGPLADNITFPDGVTSVLDDVENIF